MTAAQRKSQSAGKWLLFVLIFVVLFLMILLGLRFFHSPSSDKTVRGNNVYSADEFSASSVDAYPDSIPEYDGRDLVYLNDNKPNFTEYDYGHIAGEHYSPLDSLGRCRSAMAMLERGMMPSRERGDIGNIKPTGWQQEKYPGIVNSQPPYLYNRCHLIAYAMTGQNANELNLVTGTRYLNTDLMLPYEKQVLQYLDHSENHVLYRVTPYFKGTELLARGVEMEAYSVEDKGEGICFHVFLYNVQPGVEIEYESGRSKVGRTVEQ